MTMKMRLKMKNRSHRSRHKQTKASQLFESVLNQSNVSQYMSKHIWFSIIKMLQVCWCSQLFLEFAVAFTFFNLFDWKLEDLIFFVFYKTKFPRPKNQARQVLPAWPYAIGIGRAICLGLKVSGVQKCILERRIQIHKKKLKSWCKNTKRRHFHISNLTYEIQDKNVKSFSR